MRKKRGRVVNQSGHGFRSEEIEALLVPSFTILALVVTSSIIHLKVVQFIVERIQASICKRTSYKPI